MADMMVFTGNSNVALAQKVAQHLSIPLGNALVSKFSDGETMIDIKENVRGKDVFVVQSLSTPPNEHLMELILMGDALHRASASRITAVMPYFGYARQDRRVYSARVPISAKVIADMLTLVHIDRILTVDLHAEQIQGFFNIPVDNIYASSVLIEDIQSQKHSNFVLVSPDVGGVVRARAVAKLLNDADLAIIDKRRPAPNEAQVMNIIGEVKGKNCFIVDDMVDTAGTLCKAAKALKENGAKKVFGYCIHAVLSGQAISNIESSGLDEVVVTDTIPLSPAAQKCKRIRQLSISEILAEAMRRISKAVSISSMFKENFHG